MRDITFAPAYVALFAPLAEVARYCGYTLAVHGSVQSDLDLVAIPWIQQAEEPEYLINKLAEVLNVNLNVKDGRGMTLGTAEQKPHERLAWALPLGNGAVLDISILPKEILALRRDFNSALDKIETLENKLKKANKALSWLLKEFDENLTVYRHNDPTVSLIQAENAVLEKINIALQQLKG